MFTVEVYDLVDERHVRFGQWSGWRRIAPGGRDSCVGERLPWPDIEILDEGIRPSTSIRGLIILNEWAEKVVWKNQKVDVTVA